MSKSKESKPVSEFTEEQREWFRINKKYERKLQPFFGKSMALDSPEHKKYKAIEQERELELLKFNEKHCKPETIDTPDKFCQWIELKLVTIRTIEGLNGDYPHDVAKKSYRKAREYARKLRESNLGLPVLPPPLSDPEDGLQSMQEWCIDAQAINDYLKKQAETDSQRRKFGF